MGRGLRTPECGAGKGRGLMTCSLGRAGLHGWEAAQNRDTGCIPARSMLQVATLSSLRPSRGCFQSRSAGPVDLHRRVSWRKFESVGTGVLQRDSHAVSRWQPGLCSPRSSSPACVNFLFGLWRIGPRKEVFPAVAGLPRCHIDFLEPLYSYPAPFVVYSDS